ncbi:MAG TPA: hypothetical protein VKB88_02760 [Bryobacteraceae bacterium]|nr:hypothetical protein [Bryobacteraceae bacterium]
MILGDRGRAAILTVLAAMCVGAEPPAVEITNGQVRAKLYLPDATAGYYRATRFDWAGIVASLVAAGHNYFGQWFERYDPKVHESVMGPVEEFLSDGSGLGYAEAKAGEVFVKIGVGALRKPDEPRFRQFSTYEIVDPGKWTIHKAADRVEFVQELNAGNGYAYLYRKTLRLTPGASELVLEHSLRNTGRKIIETSVYEHNFFMLDGEPTGPDVSVRFPFALDAAKDLAPLAKLRGDTLAYLRELQARETVSTELSGFGATAADYDIRVENSKTGAGVRQRGDRPISKLMFWSIRTTVCPEAYIDLKIEPGREATWRIAYDFYSVPRR